MKDIRPIQRSPHFGTGTAMNCPKCNGCMTLDPSLDFYLQGTGWRCINCGTRQEVAVSMLQTTLSIAGDGRMSHARQRPSSQSEPFACRPLPRMDP